MKIQQYMQGAFLAAIFFTALTALSARAAEMPVSVACEVKDAGSATAAGGVLGLTAGQAVTFVCRVNNSSDQSMPILLLGKQGYETGLPMASATNVSLAAGAASEVSLGFPAIFQTGTYTYTFSAINTDTKQPVSEAYRLTGKIGGKEQATLVTVTADKDSYQWQDTVNLQVALVLPTGQTAQGSALSLHVALLDASGKECAVLAENQAVTGVTETVSLRLPKEGACIGGLSTSLRVNDTIIDQKTIALGTPAVKSPAKTGKSMMSEQSLTEGLPGFLVGGIVLTVILVVALGGFFLMRNKKRTF